MIKIADFKCEICGDIVEKNLASGDSPLCCGQLMRRLFTAPAIKFVGKDFYVNEYNKKGDKNERDKI